VEIGEVAAVHVVEPIDDPVPAIAENAENAEDAAIEAELVETRA
jgi:hypothetical protein